jgi:SSS family solute:Na+ symporter
VTTAGVFAGLASGISAAAFLMLTGRDPYRGLNAGFIALCLNFAVTGVVSSFTQVRVAGFDETQSAPAASS